MLGSLGGFARLRALRCAGAVLLVLVVGSAAASSAEPARRQTAAAPPAAKTAPVTPPLAGVSPELGLAAVVNDEVIAVFDRVSRVRMVMISSNIADTPETRQR